MHKTESFQKLQSIAIAFVFVLVAGVITNNVAAAPASPPPVNNADIVCADGEFLNSLTGTCVNGLSGIPPCKNGFLYNDTTDVNSPVIRCFNFVSDTESTPVGIDGLLCSDGISGVEWNAAKGGLKGMCSGEIRTITSEGLVARNGGWTDWTPANCAFGSNQERTCTNRKSVNGGANCVGVSSLVTEIPAKEFRPCPTLRPRPIVDIKVNGSDGPIIKLQRPVEFEVSWTSTNTSKCNIRGDGIPSVNNKDTANSGIPMANTSGTHRKPIIYTITCKNSRSTETDSVKVVIEGGTPDPIDGGWTDWTPANCAYGTTQERTCTRPAPEHNGAECPGLPTQDCPTAAVAVNGTWSEWSTCSTLDRSNPAFVEDDYLRTGNLKGTRTRTCTGASGGGTCDGFQNNQVESRECQDGLCDNTGSQQCQYGTPGNYTRHDNGNDYWACSGTNGGNYHSCIYERPAVSVDGVCGSVIQTCTTGDVDDVDRNDDGNTYWACNGENGGDRSLTCSAPTPGFEHGVCDIEYYHHQDRCNEIDKATAIGCSSGVRVNRQNPSTAASRFIRSAYATVGYSGFDCEGVNGGRTISCYGGSTYDREDQDEDGC